MQLTNVNVQKRVDRSLTSGRLLSLRYESPAENMAIDQALLESVGQSGSPTLRLYGWAEPTLSLGFFQTSGDRVRHPASSSLTLVRRSTGGGAIIHHHELTYSLTVPLPPSAAGAHHQLYRDTHGAMLDALAQFGVRADRFGEIESPATYDKPFLCFQDRTPEDLIVHGYKVLGSAQRKSRQALLQHGSLLLRCSPYAPELPGVVDLSGRSIAAAELAEQFAQTVAEMLSLPFHSGALSEREQQSAAQHVRRRYGDGDWTTRR